MSTIYSLPQRELEADPNITKRRTVGSRKSKMASCKTPCDLDYEDSLIIDSILSQDETNDIVTMLTMANEMGDGLKLPSFYTSSQTGGEDQRRRPSSPPFSPILPFMSAPSPCYTAGGNDEESERKVGSGTSPDASLHLLSKSDPGHRDIFKVNDSDDNGNGNGLSRLGSVPTPPRGDDMKLSDVNSCAVKVDDMNTGDVNAGAVNNNVNKAGDDVDGTIESSVHDPTLTEVINDDSVEDDVKGTSTDGDDDSSDGEGTRHDPDFTTPQAITEKFKQMDAFLSKVDGKSIDLTTAVSNLENSLEFSQHEIQQLKKENADLKVKIGLLETEDRRTQFQMKAVDDKLDRLETTTKKKNLIFEGIPEAEGRRENVTKSIGELFDQLKVNEGVYFEACYRMGPFKAGKTRPILVGFEKQSDRDLIYANRFDLKRTANFQNVWISEDLGPTSKKKREMIRLIAREARNQGIDCKTGKYSLRIEGSKYDHDNLEELPPQLQPTSLKQIQIDRETIAYQSEHAPFSNFFECIIVAGSHRFFCVEQVYQFLKAKSMNKPLVATKIFLSRDVRLIKLWGDELGTSPEWDAKKFDVMYGCLKKKFVQNPELKALLLSTGDMKLVEATPNRLWGCGATLSSNVIRRHDWPGLNKHGEILMTVRDELRCLTISV